MLLIKKIENFIKRQNNPDPEVFRACFNKIPEQIEVNWFRDGKYIIGEISAGGHKIITQAKSTDEFIEMVNDSLLAAYEVPQECIKSLEREKKFLPNTKALEMLNDASIKHASISMPKEKLAYA